MIDVLAPGMFSTIQDLGRIGYRKYGVPISGAMDQYSASLANMILENSEVEPVLEVTLIGPTLRFTEACQITITGAKFTTTVDELPITNNTIINIEEGGILKFGAVKEGMRAYLAIKGGFDSEVVLGSTSYYPSLTKESHLKKGGELFFKKNKIQIVESNLINKRPVFPSSNQIIEVFKGPEFDKLPAVMQKIIFEQEFEVLSQSNRMGCRLKTEDSLMAKEIITSPVQPGTVQLTPSGQLIILGRDAQTTGGYARVLQLSELAQNYLAQLQFGKKIRFEVK